MAKVDDLAKRLAEVEALKIEAKKEMRDEYRSLKNRMRELETAFKKTFDEDIELSSSPRESANKVARSEAATRVVARPVAARRSTPITDNEIGRYLEGRQMGLSEDEIVEKFLVGRRAGTLKRLKAAFGKARSKSIEGIRAAL